MITDVTALGMRPEIARRLPIGAVESDRQRAVTEFGGTIDQVAGGV
jgi:hypothetical protein